MVGPLALDQYIGVRIPASQPRFVSLHVQAVSSSLASRRALAPSPDALTKRRRVSTSIVKSPNRQSIALPFTRAA
jgi:hypothetical protein